MDRGVVQKVEELASELLAMLDRLEEKIRVITEAVKVDKRLNVTELKKQIQTLQEELYYECLRKYSDLLGATGEAERKLLAEIEHLRVLKERGEVMKELITSLVKPGRDQMAPAAASAQEQHKVV